MKTTNKTNKTNKDSLDEQYYRLFDEWKKVEGVEGFENFKDIIMGMSEIFRNYKYAIDRIQSKGEWMMENMRSELNRIQKVKSGEDVSIYFDNLVGSLGEDVKKSQTEAEAFKLSFNLIQANLPEELQKVIQAIK